jgi:hypothetical protein
MAVFMKVDLDFNHDERMIIKMIDKRLQLNVEYEPYLWPRISHIQKVLPRRL